MPIGVPKVPFRTPGEQAIQWVDVYNRLYRERVLFLCQGIDDELSNQLIGVMLLLNSEDKFKPVYLYINSPGGSVHAGLGIYDTMNYISPPVTTICVGNCASMASLILCGGERGQRVSLPHARIMIHQPEGGVQGQASDIMIESQEILRLRLQLGALYSKRTEQPLTKLARDMDRDYFLSATEAQEYGIVDTVVSNIKWDK